MLKSAGFIWRHVTPDSSAIRDPNLGRAGYTAVVLEPRPSASATQSLIETVQAKTGLGSVPIILFANPERQAANAELHVQGPVFRLRHDSPRQSMLSVIAAAQFTFRQQSNLLAEIDSRESAVGLIVSGVFRLSTLQEAENLTTMLAVTCPDRKLAAFIILELLLNAIEHGNLGIGHAEKGALLESGAWHAEIDRRLELPENQDKRVTVTFDRYPGAIRIKVADEGRGFDWKQALSREPSSGAKHGRGIALAAGLEGAHLTYEGDGSVAVLTLDVPPPGST
jgi:hypothetical protein